MCKYELREGRKNTLVYAILCATDRGSQETEESFDLYHYISMSVSNFIDRRSCIYAKESVEFSSELK